MLLNPLNAPAHIITHHAAKRIEERGIRWDALQVVLLHGDDHPAGRGCVRRELLCSKLGEIIAEGVPHEVAEMALRIEVVLSGEEELITCYRRAPRGPGWVRQRHRLGGRRHNGRR